MELVGAARSYFGGFLCVCWSPDGKYVVVGGEDDLVTVWSFYEKRVVARGQGHHSWVSVVAFDPFTTSLGYCANDAGCGSDDEFSHECNKRISTSSECNRLDSSISYRLGSVGQDTQICLWDITEDVLRQPICPRTRTNVVGSYSSTGNGSAGGSVTKCNNVQSNSIHNKDKENLQDSNTHNSPPSFTQRLVGGLGGFGDRKEGSSNHKRNLSRNSGSNPTPQNSAEDPMKLIGTAACPRFDECPLLEPLVCKKIAHERLTALVFREDCFVAACQDGYVYTWARPGKLVSNNLMSNCIDSKDL